MVNLPHIRTPVEIWRENIRPIIWKRDNKECTKCKIKLKLNECHIDHIKSGKLGTSKFNNLRTLCQRCHILRSDHRHQGMIDNALRKGLIPPNWRELVWEDETES